MKPGHPSALLGYHAQRAHRSCSGELRVHSNLNSARWVCDTSSSLRIRPRPHPHGPGLGWALCVCLPGAWPVLDRCPPPTSPLKPVLSSQTIPPHLPQHSRAARVAQASQLSLAAGVISRLESWRAG